MSDSIELDFKKSNSFLEQYNLKFTVSDMKSTSNKFKLVLVSSCYDDFEDCIDGNGVLNSSNTISHSLPCSLRWELFNADNANVYLRNTVNLSLGNTIEDLRAIFLTNNNNYVIMYCIFNNTLQITNSLTFEKDYQFFSISGGDGQ